MCQIKTTTNVGQMVLRYGRNHEAGKRTSDVWAKVTGIHWET